MKTKYVKSKLGLIALLTIAEACGNAKDAKKPERAEDHRLTEIRAKRDAYIRFYPDIAADEKGWPIDTDCDGLLFASLGRASGLPIDLTLAHGPDRGRWFRNWQRDCSSDISRDMILGLAVFIWHSRDYRLAADLVNYGEQNDWVMGNGPASRVWLSPILQGTLYQLRYKLGGADHVKRHIRAPWLPQRGYQAHLQMLHLHLRKRLGISDKNTKDTVKEIVDREQNNALFQAIGAEWRVSTLERAADVLLANTIFPNDRLPTSDDKCSHYLWERDEIKEDGSVNDDWQPCPDQNKQYSGIDFIFAASLILGEI